MATTTFPRQLLVTVDDSTNIANVTRAIEASYPFTERGTHSDIFGKGKKK